MPRLAVALSLVAALSVSAACGPEDRKSPAVMMPKSNEHEAGALVLALDRSGSMQGAKLDAVKQAATAAVDALDDNDQIAIVMFDSEARVLVPLQTIAHRQQISAEIDRLTAGGGTQFFDALRTAHDLLANAKAAVKHVILLSDGEAPYDGLVELARQIRHDQITISTIGVEGADENLLQLLSTEGGGRTYSIEDLSQLSSVFVKETRLALR